MDIKQLKFRTCLRLSARIVCFCLTTVLLLGLSPSVAVAGNAQAAQQDNKVTGQVYDINRDPLVGVTVKIVGGEASAAAITDVDGMFTVFLPSRTATLEFSYIGFKSKQVRVSAGRVVTVELEEDADELDEVVVTGYGSQKKASVVGAIQVVEPESLDFGTSHNVQNNLAGKVSGIIGVQRSGEPGYDSSSFWIRGINTFGGSNSPLVLVDGIERDLDNISVDDIESFSILKDASASAMYGVRGANGVIVINTKRGKIGPPRIKVRVEQSINSPTKFPDFMNAPDYMTLLNELADEAGQVLPFSQEQIDRTRSGYDPDLYPDVNWIDAITKDYAYTTKASLDINGGSSFLRYSVVASFLQETGILEQDHTLPYNNATNNQWITLRSNVDIDLTKTTFLAVSIGGYLHRFKKQRCDVDTSFSDAFATLPFVHPARYSDGTFPVVNARVNPYYEVTQGGYDFRTASKVETMFSLEQDLKMITPGLKIKGLFGFDRWSQSQRSRTANVQTVHPATGRDELGNLIYTIENTGDESMGTATSLSYGNSRVYLEGALTYDRRFGKVDVSAMFLYDQSSYDNGDYQDYRKQGIAGRVSGTYDDRYIAEFNFGYNGSENFAKGQRFGFFPSVAIGWLLSEEPFMRNVKHIFSKIKFRGSWGKAGDDNISSSRRFAYLTTLNTSADGYTWGTTGQASYTSGITEGEIGVTNLTWETVTKKNFGVELGLFNMLEITVDWYHENRKNIYMRRTQVPTQTGFRSNPYANFGKVKNGGVEFTIDLRKQWNKNWYTSFYTNFTYAKNCVTEYDEAAVRQGTYRSQTGRSLNELYGLTAERLFTADDFDENGNLKFGIPYQEVGKTNVEPGDIKYVDMNGDGVITEEDEGYIGGTADPRIVYGFGANIAFKWFDLNFFFQGVGDTYRIIGNTAYFLPGSGTTTQGNGYRYRIDDRWIDGVNEDPYAFWPRLSYGSNQNNYRRSTWWKKNMSFLRCKTIEVGFTLPKDWLKALYVSKCRVAVSANNMFCFSHFKMWDPETDGTTGMQYPLNKSWMFSLEIDF